MNARSALNKDYPNNLITKPSINHSCDYYYSKQIVNNLFFNKGNFQTNFVNITNKEKESIFTMDSKKPNIAYNNEGLIYIQSQDQKSLLKEPKEAKKNNVEYFSEITKFKSELCHSWEVTGSCKYGANVSFYDLNFLNDIIIVCLCPW